MWCHDLRWSIALYTTEWKKSLGWAPGIWRMKVWWWSLRKGRGGAIPSHGGSNNASNGIFTRYQTAYRSAFFVHQQYVVRFNGHLILNVALWIPKLLCTGSWPFPTSQETGRCRPTVVHVIRYWSSPLDSILCFKGVAKDKTSNSNPCTKGIKNGSVTAWLIVLLVVFYPTRWDLTSCK